jgi:hypothetical protein
MEVCSADITLVATIHEASYAHASSIMFMLFVAGWRLLLPPTHCHSSHYKLKVSLSKSVMFCSSISFSSLDLYVDAL